MMRFIRLYREHMKIEGTEHGQAFLRLTLEGSIIIYTIIMAFKGRIDPTTLYVFATTYFGAIVFFFHVGFRPKPTAFRRCLGAVFDVVMITPVLNQAGTHGAIYFFAFTFITIGNGFRYGMPYMYFCGVVAAGGIFTLMTFSPAWSANLYVGYGFLFTHVMVTGYVGALLRRNKGNLDRWKASEAASAELQVREKAAIQASELKSEFLANISHELRTPINGVMGMTDLIRATPMTLDQKSYADIISQSAETLLVLVNDILDLSRAEAGKIEIETLDVDLKKLVADVEKHIAFTAHKKGLSLALEIDADVPQAFRGDPNRLRQVLLNLAANAVKFTDSGGVTIRVSYTMSTSKMIQFDVLDTGIGVAADVIPKLFTSFSQADAKTTRKFGGSGLGLSISKHLVKLMGGEIGVESRELSGTRFWFNIPCVAAEAAKVIELNPQTITSEKTLSYNILVAEDNTTNQILITKILQKLGHRVTIAGNGAEAVSELQKRNFDFVFMDCQMPVMDGYAASMKIRQDTNSRIAALPIIALTANAMKGDREKCLEAGMTDYVSKPIKISDIQTIINRVMTSTAA